MMSNQDIRRLTPNQRNMLIDHIDGAIEVSRTFLTQVRASLMQGGLLRGHPSGSIRPRQTVLTEAGRLAVGIILGDCADALVRAGLLEQANPLQVLRALKAATTPDIPPIRPDVAEKALKRG